jgi:hypothetical protein
LASTSIPALEKSVPVNSARAETPHPLRLVDALPQMFLGSDAISEVGTAEASIPYSISISPAEVEEDQAADGSRPPIPSKFPSDTLICVNEGKVIEGILYFCEMIHVYEI